MYKIDFEKPIHIHFIGIGGISMSGLAEILLKEGFTVSGSDNKASALTEQLEKNGAKIFIGQRAANITKDIQLVVYTAAIHPDNAEWKAANDAGIPMLTCPVPGTAHGQLCQIHRRQRYPRKDNHNIHDLPHSAGSQN